MKTKFAFCIAILASLTLIGSAAHAQTGRYTTPSQKYQPSDAPPVGVRPGDGHLPAFADAPSRMTRHQMRQFAPPARSNAGVSRAGSVMPPRVDRLADPALPDLNARNVSVRPEGSSSVNGVSVNGGVQNSTVHRPVAYQSAPQSRAEVGNPSAVNGVPPIIQKTAFVGRQDGSESTSTTSSEPVVPEILASEPTDSKVDAKPQLAPAAEVASSNPILPPTRPVPAKSTSEPPAQSNPTLTATGTNIAESSTEASNSVQGTSFQSSAGFASSRDAKFGGDLRDERATQNDAFGGNVRANSATPTLSVETVGPNSIAIGKPASYRIVVENRSAIDSNRMVVSCRLPKWVEISNVITTDGHREVSQETDNHLVTWTMTRVEASQTKTMTVDVIPRQPDAFDMDVEWHLDKAQSKTKIAVTQPRLEMNIVGPEEVLFGQKAMYDVTISNVGNGTAEAVKVMLSEALGGARAALDNIAPGENKQFQVELSARSPGELDLIANAVGDGNVTVTANRRVIVRRAKLEVAVSAPQIKYAGSVATYEVKVRNSGDALAQNVAASVSLPAGVKYLSGLTGANARPNSIDWTIGNLAAGDSRTFEIHCQMNAAGKVQLDFGVRGDNELVAAGSAATMVETVADLVLSVADPKGPLPTGDEVTYDIKIQNRGSRSAQNVALVMHFTNGIEPTRADGLEYRTAPGEVVFSDITSIEPGEEITVRVFATAHEPGTHQFRAQLSCSEADSHEASQGTTRFYGKSIQMPNTRPTMQADAQLTAPAETADQSGGGSFNLNR